MAPEPVVLSVVVAGRPVSVLIIVIGEPSNDADRRLEAAKPAPLNVTVVPPRPADGVNVSVGLTVNV